MLSCFQTLDLLYKMTNPANVKEITSRLIFYLRTVSNEFIKADLVAKLTQLAERYPFYSQLISIAHDIIIIDVHIFIIHNCKK